MSVFDEQLSLLIKREGHHFLYVHATNFIYMYVHVCLWGRLDWL